MKKNITLYSFLPILMLYNFITNLFAPPITFEIRFVLWILILSPLFWIIIFPIYIITYFVATKILFKLYKIKLKNRDYFKLLFKSIALEFTFDFVISVGIITLNYFIAGISLDYIDTEMGKWWHKIYEAISYNPFTNIMALLIILVIMIIAKYMHYRFYCQHLKSWLNIDEIKDKKFALYTIILTAPYFYLIPIDWFFK